MCISEAKGGVEGSQPGGEHLGTRISWTCQVGRQGPGPNEPSLCAWGPSETKPASIRKAHLILTLCVFGKQNHTFNHVSVLPLSNSLTLESIDGKANYEKEI